MFVRRSALAIARQAGRTPIAARSFSASVTRRDAKADPSPGQEMPGKIVPFDQIKSESDLLPPGAPTGAIATDLDQATGLERLEILGKMQGVDIFDMRPLDASRKGTMEDPVIVKSFGDEQYVGCTGVPADTHGQVWLVISRNRPYERCTECGNVLKMEYVGPAEDPHGHHHGDHGHGDHGDHGAHADASTNYGGEPKSIIDYLKPEYRWGQA